MQVKTHDTELSALYETAKETLVYLTNLNRSDMQTIMNEYLQQQSTPGGFTHNSLNRLCWVRCRGDSLREQCCNFLLPHSTTPLTFFHLSSTTLHCIASQAIGSISGTLPPNEEKRFLVTVIKELLDLTVAQKGKNNKVRGVVVPRAQRSSLCSARSQALLALLDIVHIVFAGCHCLQHNVRRGPVS